MPRPLRPRGLAPLARRDDAVSEVVGYVLMLFMSSALLVLSMQAFIQSRDDVGELRAAQELRLLTDRLALEVREATKVATTLPNATYEAQVLLPKLEGHAYYVNASHGLLYANTTDGISSESSTLFNAEGSGDLQVHGTVYGAQGSLKVVYERLPSGWRTIKITV